MISHKIHPLWGPFNQPWPPFPLHEHCTYGWFTLTKLAPLASVGAGAPSALRFWWEVLFLRRSSRLTWQRYAHRRERPRCRHRDRWRRLGWRRRNQKLHISLWPKLRVRNFTAIRINAILAFAAISLMLSNLDAYSIAPTDRPFSRR